MPKKEKEHSHHPSHQGELPRVRRIKGQIEGIERMVEDGRYCVDIITQIKAAKSALQALENAVLKTHLHMCVQEAFNSKTSFNAAKKIEEITELLRK
ncbi:MAG: metal-sensitive transcriptional regulator [Bdellovibrionota bacterium]